MQSEGTGVPETSTLARDVYRKFSPHDNRGTWKRHGSPFTDDELRPGEVTRLVQTPRPASRRAGTHVLARPPPKPALLTPPWRPPAHAEQGA